MTMHKNAEMRILILYKIYMMKFLFFRHAESNVVKKTQKRIIKL